MHPFSTPECGRRFVCAAVTIALLALPARGQTPTAPYAFTTLAGAAKAGGTDGSGSAAHFNGPLGLTFDPAGNILVADTLNHSIRRITPAGNVSTWAASLGQCNTAQGIVADAAGNVFLADTGANVVRNFTAAGEMTVLAGKPGVIGTANGTGSAARFGFLNGIALNKATGDLYVADSSNQTIRKITPAGLVTTFAGSPGNAGYLDASGTAARFDNPEGLAIDSAGNVFVADRFNDVIRKITPTGAVSTYAGTRNQPGNVDGSGAAARFDDPAGLAIDAADNLYVTDAHAHTVRKITPAGLVSTIGGTSGLAGFDNGIGTTARFYQPNGIAISSSGVIYLADTGNNAIRRGTVATTYLTITSQPAATTVATGQTAALAVSVNASPAPTYQWYRGTTGDTSSPVSGAVAATLTTPPLTASTSYWARATSSAGAADSGSATVTVNTAATIAVQPLDQTVVLGRRAVFQVAAEGTPAVFTYRWQRLPAGSAVWTDLADGDRFTGARSASLLLPRTRIDVDGDQFRCWVTNAIGTAVATRTASLTITTAAATPDAVTYRFTTLAGSSSQTAGYLNGQGTAARFGSLSKIATDFAGNVYVSDWTNDAIRRITPGGLVSTYIGSAAPGTTGAGSLSPNGLAFDSAGNLFVADSLNHALRRITPALASALFAGSPKENGSADGAGATARFYAPAGLAFAPDGNLYVADSLNSTLRRVSPVGAVTTVAGVPRQSDSIDGLGTAARFYNPQGVTIDTAGTIYLANQPHETIRRVTPAGEVTTLAGSTWQNGAIDATGAAARFFYPSGLAVDSAGNVIVADTLNHALRRITPTGVVTTIGGTLGTAGSTDGLGTTARFNAPTGVAFDRAGTLYVADSLNHTIRKGTPIVSTLPVFVTQPESQPLFTGHPVKLAVAVSSATAASFQWYRGEVGDIASPVSGAIAAVFTTPALTQSLTYWVRATNTAGSTDSAAAVIAVHNELYLTFAEWQAANFTPAELVLPGISGPLADPSGRGLANLLNYALGRSARSGGFTAPVTVTTVTDNGNSFLQLAFTRKSYANDLTYFVEASDDLVTWTTLQTVAPGLPTLQQVRDSVVTSGAARRFLRLRVTTR